MLLSINEGKIAELLKSTNKGYAVYASDLPVATENYKAAYYAVFASDLPVATENYKSAYPATTEVSGVVYASPLRITEETREHLIAARRKIEESGVPLKSPEVLTREIDEMRGRR